MSMFDLFKSRPVKASASAARDRLQIVLAHERVSGDAPDFLPRLQRDIIDVIRRYVAVEDDQVAVRVERDGGMSLLEVNIELPTTSCR